MTEAERAQTGSEVVAAMETSPAGIRQLDLEIKHKTGRPGVAGL